MDPIRNLGAPRAPRLFSALLMGTALALTGAAGVQAQDLVITNAGIIDGTGNFIEQGTIVIEDGRIASVSAESAEADGAEVIDAQGMTVMPAFIDGHRHLVSGEGTTRIDPDVWLEERAEEEMRQFLEAGFTTVLSAIDPIEQITELRRRIEAGEIAGPRIIQGGIVPLAAAPQREEGEAPPEWVDPARTDVSRPPHRPTEAAEAIPDEALRGMVRDLAEAGVDAIKTVIIVTPDGPERHALTVIAEEAAAHGLPTITHAVTVEDTLATLGTGTDVLMHTPHIGQLTEEEAQRIADEGIPMVSTFGVFTPYFGENNEPLFRDMGPYPWETLSSAGQGPVNARLLWNAGITFAFGTDTSTDPANDLRHELRGLNLVFSAQDVVEIMTANSAAAVGMTDSIGTLEPGKLADIVMLDGNPLDDIHNLLNVELVVMEGEIVVDNR